MNSGPLEGKEVKHLYDIEWSMGGEMKWKMPNGQGVLCGNTGSDAK